MAAGVQRSLTLTLPPLHHLLRINQITGLRFLERMFHLMNEPFLVIEVMIDSLLYDPRTRAAHPASEAIDTFQRAAIHADSGRFFAGSHISLKNTSAYTRKKRSTAGRRGPLRSRWHRPR